MKKQKIQVYCPASISLIFKVHPDQNPLKMGSTGVGFTVDKGVTATAALSDKTIIKFNGEKIVFPTVLSVVRELTSQTVSIDIRSSLPLGSGFGLSGASALSTAFAINKLLELNKSKKELIEIAYKSEVVNRTGLGTVATQTLGGFLLKKTPGLKPKFSRLPFIGRKIYAIFFSKKETPKLLKNKTKVELINKVADKYLTKIKESQPKSLDNFFDIAYLFAKQSRLIEDEKIQQLIDRLRANNQHATITMLGNVVLATKRPELDSRYKIVELTILQDRV